MSDTSTFTVVQSSATSDSTSTSLAAFRAANADATLGQKLFQDERLMRIRRAIVKGAYQVHPRRIAGKLLKRE